ncbi:hypothetical protein F7725_004645 [Dissostichus mawsoni]|uniref:Uncharacterized protein n=1 Tax=Dissostichus mawsoni TaxID=36200 RepID=A0A7J5XJR4_DISMA|nr:hypothetical protein F7725_004645 [Dissostichus mawsoni]
MAFGACGAATWTGTCEVTGLKIQEQWPKVKQGRAVAAAPSEGQRMEQGIAAAPSEGQREAGVEQGIAAAPSEGQRMEQGIAAAPSEGQRVEQGIAAAPSEGQRTHQEALNQVLKRHLAEAWRLEPGRRQKVERRQRQGGQRGSNS